MTVKPVTQAPANILNALTKAANKTGVSFDYLLKTASRESSFDTNASATRSTAKGLFQFVENTWLGTIKEQGDTLGLEGYADKITKTSDGKYLVPDKAAREEILKLRADPDIASLVAGAYSQKNAEFLTNQIGREPSSGELYLAHFLGPSDAVRMINLQTKQPNAAATAAFPQAAKANPSIFGQGANARTVGEVYQQLMEKHGDTSLSITTTADLTKPGDPLISRNSLAPLGNLFSNAPVKLGASTNLWGTLLQQSAANAPIQKSDRLDPLAWAAGHTNTDTELANQEAWVAGNGWKVTVEWAKIDGALGVHKNVKT